MKKAGIILIVLGLVCCVDIVTGAADVDTLELENIVVTASKMPKTSGNVTQKIDVLSEDDIDTQVIGRGNITEILSYQPGYAVSVLSRNDANWGSYGGLGPKYNTYLLNGLPIDSFVDPQSLDAWSFERVETQRGPASVLYPNYLFMDFAGNQSPLSGTTNLILRDRVDSVKTRIQADFGSYKTLGTGVYHQNRIDNFHVFFGGRYEESDYTNYGTQDSWLNMVDDPEYEKTKLYLNAAYFIDDSTDHKVTFFVHRTWHSGDTGRPNRDYDHRYTTVNAGYTMPLSDGLTAALKLGYRGYDRTWEEDNYPTDLGLASENGVDQTIFPMDLSFSFAHWKGSLLTIGTDFQAASYETYSETNALSIGNDSDSTQHGIYLQEEIVWDNLVFRVGGRYNYIKHEINLLGGQKPGSDSESWDKFIWSAGIKYRIMDAISIYSNAGTSFMAPGLKSMGGTLRLEDKGVIGKDGHLPNPDLGPEEGTSYDLGIDYRITNGLFFGIRGFYSVIDNQIVQIVVSEDPSQSQDVNAGLESRACGAEVEIRHRINDRFSWFANYTYTDSEIRDDADSDQDGSELPFVPEHMGNIGINLSLPYGITVHPYAHFAGSIYDGTSRSSRKKFSSYELINMKLRKNLIDEKDYRLDLEVEFYNLTDNRFEMPWQFQDPGFSATGGIRMEF